MARKKLTYYPKVIQICDTKEIRLANSEKDLPIGQAFIIVKT